MQLVLIGDRVVARGENFLAMGGTVINTETGAKYENATIAECEGCPSDIDSVGYEYHAGQFIPCAPYGKGDNNGYFMEVCKGCATPRNSGIKIQEYKDLKEYAYGLDWETLAEISINQSGAQHTSVAFNVDAETLMNYTEIAIIVKSGFTLNSVASTAQGYASISVGSGQRIRCESTTSNGSPNYMSISNDVILVTAKWGVDMTNSNRVNNVKARFTPDIDVNAISVGTAASGCYVRGNIELRGRK